VPFYRDPVVPFSYSSWFSGFLQLGGGRLFLPLLAHAAVKTSSELSKPDLVVVDSSRVGSELLWNSQPNPLFHYWVQNKLYGISGLCSVCMAAVEHWRSDFKLQS